MTYTPPSLFIKFSNPIDRELLRTLLLEAEVSFISELGTLDTKIIGITSYATKDVSKCAVSLNKAVPTIWNKEILKSAFEAGMHCVVDGMNQEHSIDFEEYYGKTFS